MGQFLARRSSIGQYDRDTTKKCFIIIFRSKVMEVYLIVCSGLEDYLCSF